MTYKGVAPAEHPVALRAAARGLLSAVAAVHNVAKPNALRGLPVKRTGRRRGGRVFVRDVKHRELALNVGLGFQHAAKRRVPERVPMEQGNGRRAVILRGQPGDRAQGADIEVRL